MPYYFPIKHFKDPAETERTADRLLALRRQLRRDVPRRTVDDTLLLATWNVRNFDSNRFGHGPRLKESFFYIAEIISSFDLVAVQEVDNDLSALKIVMRILGPTWDYIVTDTTEGVSGNNERIAFLYDTRKVRFQNIAGEIVLSDSRLIGDSRQFARTPFLVAFQSGWFRFMICSVHIYYGADSGEKLERRVEEIRSIARLLSKRADDESANYVVLGDFNIVSPEHETHRALTDGGFIIPEALADVPSNFSKNKHYDQIAFKPRPGQVRFSGRAGVFDPYESIFSEGDETTYYPHMTKRDALALDDDGAVLDNAANRRYFLKQWRTFQISDHLPMWVELSIDFSDQYLHAMSSAAPVSFSAGDDGASHPMDFAMPELESDG